MSPIDDELRTALQAHAGDALPSPDPFTRIERRARGIHRRRVAGVAAGTALALAAVIGGGTAAFTAFDADRGHSPGVAHQPGVDRLRITPAPSASTVPASATDVMGWPFTGDRGAAANAGDDVVLAQVAHMLPSGWPAPTRLNRLWAGTDDFGEQVLVFAAQAGAHVVAGAWVSGGEGGPMVERLHDVEPDAVQVSVYVRSPQDPKVSDAVIVARPGVGQILWAPTMDGRYTPVEDAADPRVAAFTVATPVAGQPVPFVEVLDGDGNLDRPLVKEPIARGLTFPDV